MSLLSDYGITSHIQKQDASKKKEERVKGGIVRMVWSQMLPDLIKIALPPEGAMVWSGKQAPSWTYQKTGMRPCKGAGRVKRARQKPLQRVSLHVLPGLLS